MRIAWIACVVAASVSAVRTSNADPRLDRALAEQKCQAHDPSCDWIATLSTLERATVERAIAARGYQLDPQPWGKTIGKIAVFNEDVFAEKTPLLTFFNIFHVTTRESAITVEAVMEPGQVWNQDLVDETARRLRDPLYSSVVVVLPLASAQANTVDVLIVTRDIWSLRLNTQYTYVNSSSVPFTRRFQKLIITLSENNFFGTRKIVALGFTMDQGAIAVGPLFVDKNVLGEHYTFSGRVDAIYGRDSLEREGSDSTFTLSKSLWRLSEEWGGSVSFNHRNAIVRSFNGFDLRQVQCPVDGSDCFNPQDPTMVPAEELVPRTYSSRTFGASVSATRQWGTDIKQQVSVGHSIGRVKAEPLGTFPGNDAQRAAFIASQLPRSEFTSTPFITFAAFTPRFRTFRNIGTYDLAEDARFGFGFDASYSVGLTLLGSDNNFQTAGTSVSYSIPVGRDGLASASTGISARLQKLEGTLRFIDESASLGARFVTPTFTYARVVAELALATRWNDTQNRNFALGGPDNGLRGYLTNELFGIRTGDRFASLQVEARSIPVAFWVLRTGAVAFYEAGGVADTFHELKLAHDIGIGARMLVPQLGRELFRFDLAMPLTTTAFTKGGTLIFTAGFQSAF